MSSLNGSSLCLSRPVSSLSFCRKQIFLGTKCVIFTSLDNPELSRCYEKGVFSRDKISDCFPWRRKTVASNCSMDHKLPTQPNKGLYTETQPMDKGSKGGSALLDISPNFSSPPSETREPVSFTMTRCCPKLRVLIRSRTHCKSSPDLRINCLLMSDNPNVPVLEIMTSVAVGNFAAVASFAM